MSYSRISLLLLLLLLLLCAAPLLQVEVLQRRSTSSLPQRHGRPLLRPSS
jgi:hypothetical protein